MKIAALYDIHGNLPALEAVLDEIRQEQVGCIVVGGDVIPGPMPIECLALLLGLDIPVRFLRGNGEREVLARRRGLESRTLPAQVRHTISWTAEQLTPKYEQLLAGWPETLVLALPPPVGEVLFCHATPRNDTEIFTRLTPDVRLSPVFAGVSQSIVLCGHTHMQFDRTIGQIRVLNAGSVGMPFGEPGAYWLLFGPGIRLRHTGYDFGKAAGRVRDTPYPKADDFAQRNILQPPSETDMLEAFSRAELH